MVIHLCDEQLQQLQRVLQVHLVVQSWTLSRLRSDEDGETTSITSAVGCPRPSPALALEEALPLHRKTAPYNTILQYNTSTTHRGNGSLHEEYEKKTVIPKWWCDYHYCCCTAQVLMREPPMYRSSENSGAPTTTVYRTFLRCLLARCPDVCSQRVHTRRSRCAYQRHPKKHLLDAKSCAAEKQGTESLLSNIECCTLWSSCTSVFCCSKNVIKHTVVVVPRRALQEVRLTYERANGASSRLC